MNRAEIEQRLVERLSDRDGPGPPMIIVEGPRGAGKSVLLDRAAARLAARGVLPVALDVERAGTGPESLACRLAAAAAGAARLAGAGRFSGDRSSLESAAAAV
ncbi:MAG TPA: hypothetical protein VJV23_08865, partial [Candidatus Polarisedimenticolia bacterium]|nr:hypothetical protein [Candidatus Polarisedimenticolia bacterium]